MTNLSVSNTKNFSYPRRH